MKRMEASMKLIINESVQYVAKASLLKFVSMSDVLWEIQNFFHILFFIFFQWISVAQIIMKQLE